MNKYDLSKESNDGIGKAIGACVGTVVAILAKEALDKWLGDDKWSWDLGFIHIGWSWGLLTSIWCVVCF